jgi:hypothetical protein
MEKPAPEKSSGRSRTEHNVGKDWPVAATTRKKGNTGKRYSDDQKKTILDYVKSEGRGGITRATKKFGVSYIALARWMKGKGGGKGKVGRPKGSGSDKRTKKKVLAALKAFKGLKKQFTLVQRLMKAIR